MQAVAAEQIDNPGVEAGDEKPAGTFARYHGIVGDDDLGLAQPPQDGGHGFLGLDVVATDQAKVTASAAEGGIHKTPGQAAVARVAVEAD